jgi:HD superfamily phosphodiesterase
MITYRDQAIEEMKKVFVEAPYGVDHTLRVLANAEQFLSGESVEEEMREVVILAAVLHDTGAMEAMRKYGSMEGAYQEKEGEVVARQILERIGAPETLTERVCYLVAHHHTPEAVVDPDFQILWEADLLDNLEYAEEKKDRDELERLVAENFKTHTGREIAKRRLLAIK